jgi:hypothetical protein
LASPACRSHWLHVMFEGQEDLQEEGRGGSLIRMPYEHRQFWMGRLSARPRYWPCESRQAKPDRNKLLSSSWKNTRSIGPASISPGTAQPGTGMS